MSRASKYSGSPQGFSQHRAVRPRFFFHRLMEVHFTVHPFTSLQVVLKHLSRVPVMIGMDYHRRRLKRHGCEWAVAEGVVTDDWRLCLRGGGSLWRNMGRCWECHPLPELTNTSYNPLSVRGLPFGARWMTLTRLVRQQWSDRPPSRKHNTYRSGRPQKANDCRPDRNLCQVAMEKPLVSVVASGRSSHVRR